jgi:hypothetical protein
MVAMVMQITKETTESKALQMTVVAMEVVAAAVGT